MRGMDRLIEIRRSGRKPDLLALCMAGMSSGIVMDGEVVREASDNPTTTDLRPLVGLSVIVMGQPFGGFEEAEAWARAVCRAGAKNVGLAFASLDAHPDDGPVWLRANGEDLA